jgi:hypothetical protein
MIFVKKEDVLYRRAKPVGSDLEEVLATKKEDNRKVAETQS